MKSADLIAGTGLSMGLDKPAAGQAFLAGPSKARARRPLIMGNLTFAMKWNWYWMRSYGLLQIGRVSAPTWQASLVYEGMVILAEP